MARAIWSGSITFGLVSIPIKLYSATEQKDVRFNLFQEGTGKRIRYKRVPEGGDEEVDWDDIVKGYEVEDGQFVIVTPEELEEVEPRKTRTIEIEDFVDIHEIDPIYYEKTYFVGPQEGAGAERPYALLLRAMEETERVGIARFVMRTKEYLATIRPSNGILFLETMYFPDEVRSTDAVDYLPEDTEVPERELRIARQLIGSLSTDWEPEKYRDTYRERVLELVQAKAEGREIVVEEEAEAARPQDLMEALRASVEATRGGDLGRRRERRTRQVDAGPRGAAGDGDLDSLSKDELYERAQEADIPGRSRMSKEELAEALRKAS